MYDTAVIDSNSACLEHISGLLKDNRYINSVTCYCRWVDYLGELKHRNIHIAFIRVDSPGLHGLSLARVTRGMSPDVRIVFISGVNDYAVIAFEEKASGYLMWPATQKDIDEVIENIRAREHWKRGDLSE